MNVAHPPIAPPDDHPVVLVADDAPSSLEVLCETLESSGYIVLLACDADTALRCLALTTPDIILMDAVMSGMSGFDICRHIKSDLTTKHIPVIFMTGLSDTSHVLEGFACGGVDYVVKPARAQEVLARLHTHLRNARLARFALNAIDVLGLGVVMLNQQGAISWCSPYAKQLLLQFGMKPDVLALPRSWWGGDSNMELLASTLEPAGANLLIRNMGAPGMDGIMLLLELSGNHIVSTGRLVSAALTPRETEVLSWLVKGKTNRDIGDILQLSPRTVSKHLEHIFEKLGVETRSAAVAMASAQEYADARLTSGIWPH